MNHEARRRWSARTPLGLGLLIIGLLPILGGCYPYDRESTSDYDVIATTFDPNADFSTKLTYAMPDQIRLVTDPAQPPTSTINPTVQAAILSEIDQNMAALGYTKVADPTVANVQITPFAVENTWVGGSCYPYYYDYWYGGSGWCYPVYYSYTTGTVVVPMFDPTLPVNSEPIWIAGINGIINTDTPSAVASRARNAIDSAFNQSPYLAH
jgi:hypothetical protein